MSIIYFKYPHDYMSDKVVPQIKAWLDSHQAELLSDFKKMLQIPSIEAAALPNAPFGQANRDALNMALEKAKEWGMTTKDLEGYCGWAEFGSGEKLILILGHLDVVPVGPGWKFDPFSATEHDGYVYARGATDDKGPSIAAFYAARAIQETVKDLGARIRFVFGCNEESGFKCIERYVETEEMPTYGIAPDAGWPLYHAEKGIADLIIRVKPIKGEMTFVSLQGGQRPNIVIDSAVGVVKVAATSRAVVEEKLAKSWDKNLTYSWNGDLLTVNAIGKAAHGARPFSGDNAATRVMRFWMEIAPVGDKYAFEDLLDIGHISGMGVGIHGCDELTQLTANLGIVKMVGDEAEFTVNVRYPVTWKGETVKSKCEAYLKTVLIDARLADFSDSKPLYFPLDHPLVKTVVDVYEEETGERKAPGIMGGGTYARAVPNTVAIGTGWQGDGEAHQTDERLKIEHLYKMSRIYAHIIYRLSQS